MEGDEGGREEGGDALFATLLHEPVVNRWEGVEDWGVEAKGRGV